MLVLGSSSLARQKLLNSVGLVPDSVKIPSIDESMANGELPRLYVMRMAREKAEDLAVDEKSFLITADTIVTMGKRVLPKTFSETDAFKYLKSLSGRRHCVYTAFCIKHRGSIHNYLVKTTLKMRLLKENEIESYILSKEWVGCAGAYSIQGKAKCFFPFISGCFSNVIGLPLPKLISVLNGMSFPFKKYDL